jgi:hypothetical protein
MMSIAKHIKAKLSLRDVARLCGIELPERDKVKFRAPFRPDQTPSCTVFHDRINDWSTGEKIDAIELYALAKRITVRRAIGELARHLGLNGERRAEPVRKWPVFDSGTLEDVRRRLMAEGSVPRVFALRKTVEYSALAKSADSAHGSSLTFLPGWRKPGA